MVEGSNQNNAAAGTGAGGTGDGGDEWITEDYVDLDAEEQAKLAVFLSKVKMACQNDSELPTGIGAEIDTQVSKWLAEITDSDQVAVADTGDSGAMTSSSAATNNQQQPDAATEAPAHDTGAGPGGSTGEAP